MHNLMIEALGILLLSVKFSIVFLIYAGGTYLIRPFIKSLTKNIFNPYGITVLSHIIAALLFWISSLVFHIPCFSPLFTFTLFAFVIFTDTITTKTQIILKVFTGLLIIIVLGIHYPSAKLYTINYTQLTIGGITGIILVTLESFFHLTARFGRSKMFIILIVLFYIFSLYELMSALPLPVRVLIAYTYFSGFNFVFVALIRPDVNEMFMDDGYLTYKLPTNRDLRHNGGSMKSYSYISNVGDFLSSFGSSQWHTTWWGALILTVIGGVVSALLISLLRIPVK